MTLPKQNGCMPEELSLKPMPFIAIPS